MQCQYSCWDTGPEISKWLLFKFFWGLLDEQMTCKYRKNCKNLLFCSKTLFRGISNINKKTEKISCDVNFFPHKVELQSRGHTFLGYPKHYLCAKAVFTAWFPWNRWPIDIYTANLENIIHLCSIYKNWMNYTFIKNWFFKSYCALVYQE